MDSTRTIFYSAKRFFSGTLISRITGLIRDISMASAFGINAPVAAFLLAFRLSHFFRRIFGEGALNAAFTPAFEEARSKNQEEAYRFFTNIFLSLMLFLILLILMLAGILGAALFYGDLSAGNRQVVYLTFLMLPGLLFICLYGLNASFLQCEKKYFLPSIAPVGFNLCWIAGIYFLYETPIDKAMTGMAIFINLACMAQWAVTLPQTLRLSGLSINWKLTQIREIKNLLSPFCLAVFGVISTQVNSAIDPLFARYAEVDGPALLWYAIRLQQLPLALFGIALSTAILPPLSRKMKENNLDAFLQFFRFGVRKALFVMIPVTGAIFVMGGEAVLLLYRHGDFSLSDAARTNWCLWLYAIGLAPATLILIYAPAFYSRKNYQVPMRGSFISLTSNIFFNSFFIMGLGWGAASVALATSISAFLNLGYLAFHFRKEVSKNVIRLTEIGQITAATLAASLTVILFKEGFGMHTPQQFTQIMLHLGLFAFTYSIVYLIAYSGLKRQGIKQVIYE